MSETVQKYLAKAKESLGSAKDDLAEKRFNSCASRVYYACYQAAVASLIKHGLAPRGGKVLWRHDFVHSRFGFLTKRKKLYPSKIKAYLSELMESRITADYREAMVSKRQAKRVLQKAKEFVSIILKEEKNDQARI